MPPSHAVGCNTGRNNEIGEPAVLWSGWPFPSPGDLPDPGIEPVSPVLAGGFFTADPPGEPRETCRELTIIGEKIITGLLLPCDS